MPGLPSSSVSEVTKPSTASAGDVLDILNSDDTPNEVELEPKPKATPKPKEDDNRDDDEDDKGDDEVELKEDKPDEDKIDLKDDEPTTSADDEIVPPPRKKEITAKYPNIFKDFPFLEKMMFRDRQYTELFGSFDDAKEAAGRSQALAEFEADILNGNTERLLVSIKNVDQRAFDKIVDGYMNTLARVDKDAYLEVAGNVAKHIIRQMATQAKNSGDEELQKAALLLNRFLFNSNEYTPPKPRVEQTQENQSNEVLQERMNWVAERFEASRNELQTKVDNTLKATISEYIDPKGEMSPYVKRNAIRDALNNVHSAVHEDGAFQSLLDRLWKSAAVDKFSPNSINRIRSAYLGRSKQVLSTVIKKARAEALKDSTPSRRTRDDEEEPSQKRGPIPAGRPHQSSGKLKREKGESVMEFLSRD